ncbi:uncharacterized protein MONBRDRAFT_22907 [Monosiga brevicollis MX1]|uniref:Endonuclease/exonuclease/phosphatase domain-containing protein n=1 Tax=Monosiga brevicollis TaxID=81824 RepID=A9USF1_MONBE|nr:uncharacterized protein MONBRDRAFT_22907 [Monosiga brevicollis MX1]EDQ92091.1 predicted protein [Monosiga brevicollis MX1]|eukprot:XP_001743377.1 hypothetical protein [Monosiga brevicollis MX1]
MARRLVIGTTMIALAVVLTVGPTRAWVWDESKPFQLAYGGILNMFDHNVSNQDPDIFLAVDKALNFLAETQGSFCAKPEGITYYFTLRWELPDAPAYGQEAPHGRVAYHHFTVTRDRGEKYSVLSHTAQFSHEELPDVAERSSVLCDANNWSLTQQSDLGFSRTVNACPSWPNTPTMVLGHHAWPQQKITRDLKLVSYNIWNVNKFQDDPYLKRMERLTSEIHEANPDVIAFQEEYILLSREIHRPDDAHQRAVLRVTVLSPQLGPFHVFVSHFALDQRARLRGAVETYEFIDRHHAPAAFCGDLNAEPDSQTIRYTDEENDRDYGLTFDRLKDKMAKRIDFIFLKLRNQGHQEDDFELDSIELLPE